MKNSKLLDIFQSFSRQELRWLRDFVYSPFYNKNQSVRQLCEVLISEARKGFNERNIKARFIFEKAFPDITFDDKQFSYLAADLLKLCEQFITLKAFEADGHAAALYRLQACQERQLEKSFQRRFKQSQSALEASQPLSIPLLWQRYQFSQLAEDRFAATGSRTVDPYLQQAADALDNFYYTQKLRLSCAMLARQAALNENYELRFIQTDQLAELSHLPHSELAQLYQLSFQLQQTDNDPELLQLFTGQLRQHTSLLAPAEITELFLHAITYCIQQIRKGYRQFTDVLLALYQESLQAGYLLEKGELSPWNYKNIIKLGLGLKQFDWVESFVEQYTRLLPQQAQADSYHFNLADISYHQKKYDTALSHLHHAEFTDIHYTLGAKTMLIKIFYEREDTEALLSLLSSFHLFLLRNKLIGQSTKSAYFNFLKFTKKLERLRLRHKLEELQGQLRQAAAVNDRSWLERQLLEKIDRVPA